MDAGKYYALLRFEEASLALRAALKLNLVEEMGESELDLLGLGERFGFTHQGARTFARLLEVMEVLSRTGPVFRVATRAVETLSDAAATSRKPYFEMGADDRVDVLIAGLRGSFPENSLPLYGGDNDKKTVMDLPEVGRQVAMGLASRARNFAHPLAEAILPYAEKSKVFVDLGAGSPYVALACLGLMPKLKSAILVDRANSMQFAREMADEFSPDDRLEFREQDFFDTAPPADLYCISNTAHDWLAEEYVAIMVNVRDAIVPGGTVCVHEPLLLSNWNSAEQWVSALWMACYALTLYQLTEGKGTCYTREEHNEIMSRCGFLPIDEPRETCDGCTALFFKLKGDITEAPAAELKTAHRREQKPSSATMTAR